MAVLREVRCRDPCWRGSGRGVDPVENARPGGNLLGQRTARGGDGALPAVPTIAGSLERVRRRVFHALANRVHHRRCEDRSTFKDDSGEHRPALLAPGLAHPRKRPSRSLSDFSFVAIPDTSAALPQRSADRRKRKRKRRARLDRRPARRGQAGPTWLPTGCGGHARTVGSRRRIAARGGLASAPQTAPVGQMQRRDPRRADARRAWHGRTIALT